jgi:hypothetical protein
MYICTHPHPPTHPHTHVFLFVISICICICKCVCRYKYIHWSLSLARACSLSHTHTGHLRDTKARLLSTAGPTDGLVDMDVALVAENALFTVTTAFALSRVRSNLYIH